MKPLHEIHSQPNTISYAVAYSEPIPAPSWRYGFWIDDRCHLSITGAITCSGHVKQGFGPDGYELIPPCPANIPYMIGARTDVPGAAFAACADNPGSCLFAGYAPDGKQIACWNADGSIDATGLRVNGEALEDLITRVVKTVTGGTGK